MTTNLKAYLKIYVQFSKIYFPKSKVKVMLPSDGLGEDRLPHHKTKT